MPGPAPKVDPVRRNARAGLLKLPAEGRRGRAPRWPLADGPDDGVRKLWAQLWRTPQAVAWERLGWTRSVARYALILQAAERLETAAMAEARQMEDRLGLTPKAMRMLLWEIAADEVTEQRVVRDDVRKRVRAV